MAGRGLEALIPSRGQKPVKFTLEKEAVFLVEIEKIKPNPHQPRRDFNQEELSSLSESIREHGILQPLIVTKTEKESEGKLEIEYELVAGERRLQAAKIAGFSQVPVIVRKPSEQQKLEISLVENIQRADLNPMEEARAFKRLADEFNLSQKEIAQKVGKSREAIANTMRILNLPLEIQKDIEKNRISEGHARAILLVSDTDKQKILAERTKKENLSVRRVEELAHKILFPSEKKVIEGTIPKELKYLEEKLKKIFKIETLNLRSSEGKIRLTIEFESEKDLMDFEKNLSNY